MDNLDHPFDFLRRDRPGTALFPQQVHYVSGKFVTGLKQTKTKHCTLRSINHSTENASNLSSSLLDKLLIKNVKLSQGRNLGTFRVRRHDERRRTDTSETRRKVLRPERERKSRATKRESK